MFFLKYVNHLIQYISEVNGEKYDYHERETLTLTLAVR